LIEKKGGVKVPYGFFGAWIRPDALLISWAFNSGICSMRWHEVMLLFLMGGKSIASFIERFHVRGQQPCKVIGTKEIVYIR